MIDDLTLAAEASGPGRDPIALARGEELGRYVVLDQLGRGGMGVVYAAYDPVLDRKVALKVLLAHGGEDSTLGQPRLLREAQALAKLSHPYVVAVHDVGALDDSVFIAMEFVDGVTLERWAANSRSWREIVAVLIAAGRGIAAAHRAGIIHRDFKPANVIIDGDDRPRVLDFGLARAASEGSGTIDLSAIAHELGGSSSFSSKLTQTGALIGTPAYMAPEQYTGERIDERTDQFAFCVSAYEALYGERPFAGDSLAALAFAAHQGKISDAPAGTQVPGWIRRILLRGLAVDPSARWPSMDALLEALARDPVRRRRRIAAALAGLAVVVGLGALVQQQLARTPELCTAAGAPLVAVWDADARAAIEQGFAATGVGYASEAARGFTAALDEYTSAWADMRTEACAATRIRGEQSDEVLSLRVACLDRQLAQVGALVEVYREADAAAVERALEGAASLPPLAACADVDSLLMGVRPPTSAEQREQVNALRLQIDAAASLERAGKGQLARERLAAIRDEVVALGYRPLIAEFDLAYAPMLASASERVELLEQALWMAEASHHDLVAARVWLRLIASYASDANNFDRAAVAIDRADAAIARLGDDPELRLRLLVEQGRYLGLVGEDERALELLSQARAERERRGEAGTPEALDELVTLTNVLMDRSRSDEAGPLLERALVDAQAQLGAGHPWVARTRATLARVYYESGRFAEAEAALKAALEVYEQSLGASQQVVGVLNGLALVQTEAGRPEDAHASYERALALAVELFGSKHLQVAIVANNLASLERGLGRHEQALARYEQVLAIRAAVYAGPHLQIALTHDSIAETLRRMGKLDEAEAGYRRGLELVEELEGPDGPSVVYGLQGLAKLALARDDPRTARALVERALAVVEDPDKRKLVGLPTVAKLRFVHAQALEADGARTQALAQAQQGLADARSAVAHGDEIAAEIEAWLRERGVAAPAPAAPSVD